MSNTNQQYKQLHEELAKKYGIFPAGIKSIRCLILIQKLSPKDLRKHYLLKMVETSHGNGGKRNYSLVKYQQMADFTENITQEIIDDICQPVVEVTSQSDNK